MAGKTASSPDSYCWDGYISKTLETVFGTDIEVVYCLESVQPGRENPSLAKLSAAESPNTTVCKLVLVLNREAESRPELFWLGAASVRRVESDSDWDRLIGAIAATVAEEAQKRLDALGYDGHWRIGLMIDGGVEFFTKDSHGVLRSVQTGAAIYYRPVHGRN